MKTATKERPIIFSAPMIRAILAGRKTQTRRVIRLPVDLDEDHQGAMWELAKSPQYAKPGDFTFIDQCHPTDSYPTFFRCPYGQVGDVLWVRETWRAYGRDRAGEWEGGVEYRADLAHRVFRDHVEWNLGRDWCANRKTGGWGSPIHMPRWASRITLELTDVRVERLQEITGKDIAAEGFPFSSDIDQYKLLWNNLNASRGYSWESNPYVWVLTFKRIEET